MKSTRTKFIVSIALLIFAVTTVNPSGAQAQSDRISFAVIGDFGLAGQPLLDISNLIKSWNPDFIVTVGDNNYPNGAASTIDDNIGQYFHEYIYEYSGKYGTGSPTMRFYPSLGNHDWSANGTEPYLNYFGRRNVWNYYDFVKGPVHFFMLDSDRDEPDGVTPDSQQGIWLRKGLAASTSVYNVVVLHHAPYSSGRHGSNAYMQWPFKEWGADVVLAGHDHVYERLLADGLPYFVNGIGGAELYRFENVLPQSQARFNSDFGAMRVEASGQYMRFRMFSRTGALVDEYVIGAKAATAVSITRVNASPANSAVVDYRVSFSDSVGGVDVSDFILDTNINGAGVASVSGSGNSYIVSVNTGSGDGTLRLDLADNDSITTSLGLPLGWEGAGNGNFSGETYSMDKTPPVVLAITRNSPNPTNAASVDFAVTFNESVSGVDLADFSLSTLAGATLAGINGSGSSYTVTVATGNGNDEVRLDFIDNDSIFDPAGNTTQTGFTSGESYSVDRAAPTVVSIIPSRQPDAPSVDFTVSFSEPVSGVDGGDFSFFTMNGATVTTVTGGGSQYIVSVSIQPGRDSLRLDLVDNDSILDGIGNPLGGAGFGNGNALGGILNIDIATPIATSIIRASANPTNAPTASFIVTFSEAVEGVDAGDFSLTNGSINDIQNLSPFFIVNVSTGAADGEMRLDLLDDDSIHNAQGISLGGNGAGNGNFSGETFTIDRTPPRVTSIIRAGSNPAINPTADFIVTFSEPVLGVETTDFTISGSNVILSSILTMQNADPFYWLTAQTGAGSGAIRLDLFDNGNISDHAGNPLANNGFTLGESFSLAKTPVGFSAPVVTAIPGGLTNNAYSPPSWSAVPNARAYEVFIARDSAFSKIVLTQTIEGATLATQTPLADGGYYMKVRAYNADLSPGKFSSSYFFTLDATPPAAPKPKSPKNNASTPSKPNFEWASVAGAVRYQIEIDNNADFSSPEFSATPTRTFVQTKALIGRAYYWRIRARDAAGNWSAWSTVFKFNVR